MQLAFYKANSPRAWAYDRWVDRLSGGGGYSHVELVFSDGLCFSSSPRDGGTRFKLLDVTDTATWELVPTEGCVPMATAWATARSIATPQRAYNWLGVFGFVLPRLRAWDSPGKRWFCSEACAFCLGYHNLLRTSPNYLYKEIRGIS